MNASEVVARCVDQSVAGDDAIATLHMFDIEVALLTSGHAEQAGVLRAATRKQGLSLGDRCCLALALERRAKVLTADRAWAGLDLGIEIEVIRCG